MEYSNIYELRKKIEVERLEAELRGDDNGNTNIN